jgi:hypothetical protein
MPITCTTESFELAGEFDLEAANTAVQTAKITELRFCATAGMFHMMYSVV